MQVKRCPADGGQGRAVQDNAGGAEEVILFPGHIPMFIRKSINKSRLPSGSAVLAGGGGGGGVGGQRRRVERNCFYLFPTPRREKPARNHIDNPVLSLTKVAETRAPAHSRDQQAAIWASLPPSSAVVCHCRVAGRGPDLQFVR